MLKGYKVLIEGRNLLVRIEGEKQKVGFYTTRIVEARNSSDAGKVAIDLILQNSLMKNELLNESNDAPIIDVDKVERIYDLDRLDEKPPGFSFYLEVGENRDET